MRYETHTQLSREQVFEAAKKFFGEGEGGLSMKVSSEQGNQLAFFGQGLVWLTVWPTPPGRPARVDLDISERDSDAKAFVERVLKGHVPAGSVNTSV